MKKIIGFTSVLFICFAFNFSSKNQNSGIKFEHISFAKALEIAKAKDKIIFIDAYTSWCGPCKRMAATSFKEENVAKLYNSRFINLKIDMESSPDGPEIARMYKVKAYPTLLFIKPNGKLAKSVVGFQTGEKLISIGSGLD
jgi:thioredoxin 1